MSHQPFETWILDVEQAPPAERRALQEHLETCPQCRALQSKWQLAQRELRTRTMVSPAPGFAERWQSGLAERKAREARQQAWRAFLLFVGASLALLVLMAGYVLATSSPADWLGMIVRSLSDALTLVGTVIGGARIWLSRTPLALNIAIWVYLALTLCLLSLGWVFALWRTSIVGVFNR